MNIYPDSDRWHWASTREEATHRFPSDTRGGPGYFQESGDFFPKNATGPSRGLYVGCRYLVADSDQVAFETMVAFDHRRTIDDLERLQPAKKKAAAK